MDLSNRIFSPPRHKYTKFNYNKQLLFVYLCLCAFVAIPSGLSGLGFTFRLLFFQSVLVTFLAIPDNLVADATDNSYFLCPQLHAGEKTAQVVHKIVRIIRIDKADTDQRVF